MTTMPTCMNPLALSALDRLLTDFTNGKQNPAPVEVARGLKVRRALDLLAELGLSKDDLQNGETPSAGNSTTIGGGHATN